MERLKLRFALKILVIFSFVIGYAEMTEKNISLEEVFTKSDSRTDLLSNRNSSRENDSHFRSERLWREGGFRPEPHPFDPNLSPLNPEPNEKKEIISSFMEQIEASSNNTHDDHPKQRKLRSFREMQLPGSFIQDYKHIADVLKRTHSQTSDYYIENYDDTTKKKPRALERESGSKDGTFELKRNFEKTFSNKNDDKKELFERTRRNGQEKRPEVVAFRSGQHASLLTYRSPVDPEEQGSDKEGAEGLDETTVGEDETNTGESGTTDGETGQTTDSSSKPNGGSTISTDEGYTSTPMEGEEATDDEGVFDPISEGKTLTDGTSTDDQESDTTITDAEKDDIETTIDTGSPEIPDSEGPPEGETTGTTQGGTTPEDTNTEDVMEDLTTSELDNTDGIPEETIKEAGNTGGGILEETTLEAGNTDDIHEETTLEEGNTDGIHEETTLEEGNTDGIHEETTLEAGNTDGIHEGTTAEKDSTGNGMDEITTGGWDNTDDIQEKTTAEDNTGLVTGSTLADTNEVTGSTSMNTFEDGESGGTTSESENAGGSTGGIVTEGRNTDGMFKGTASTKGRAVKPPGAGIPPVKPPGTVIPPGSKPLDLTRNVSYIVDKASNMSYFQEYISNITLPKNQSEENARPSNQSRLISFLLDKDISYLQDKIRNIASLGDESRNLTFIHDKALKLTFLEANSLNKTTNSSDSDDEAIESSNVSFLDDQARNISFYRNNHRYLGSPGNKSEKGDSKCPGGSCKPDTFEPISSKKDLPPISDVPAETNDQPPAPKNLQLKAKGDCFCMTWESPPCPPGVTVIGHLLETLDEASGTWKPVAKTKTPNTKAKFFDRSGKAKKIRLRAYTATGVGPPTDPIDVMKAEELKPGSRCACGKSKNKEGGPEEPSKGRRKGGKNPSSNGEPGNQDTPDQDDGSPNSKRPGKTPKAQKGGKKPQEPRKEGNNQDDDDYEPDYLTQDLPEDEDETPKGKRPGKTPKGGKKGPGNQSQEPKKRGGSEDPAKGGSKGRGGKKNLSSNNGTPEEDSEPEYLNQDLPEDDDQTPGSKSRTKRPGKTPKGGKKGKQSPDGGGEDDSEPPESQDTPEEDEPAKSKSKGKRPGKNTQPGKNDNPAKPAPGGAGPQESPKKGGAGSSPKKATTAQNYGYSPDLEMCPPVKLGRRVQRGCLYLSWEYDGSACKAMVRGNVLERWDTKRQRWRKIGEIHNPSPMGRICTKGAADFTVRIRSFGGKGIGPPSEVLDPSSKRSTGGPLSFRNIQADDFTLFVTDSPKQTKEPTKSIKAKVPTKIKSEPTKSPKLPAKSGKKKPNKYEFKALAESGFPNYTKGFACTPLLFNITSFSDACAKLEWDLQGGCTSDVGGGVLELRDSAQRRWRKVGLLTVSPPPPHGGFWCDGSVRPGQTYRLRFFTRSDNGSLAISPPSRGAEVPEQTHPALMYRSMQFDNHDEDKFVPISSKSVLQNTEKGFSCWPLKLRVTSFNGTCAGLSWQPSQGCPGLVNGSFLERRDPQRRRWVRVARLETPPNFGWHCDRLGPGQTFRLRLYTEDDKGNVTVGPPSRPVQIPAPGVHSIVRRSYGDVNNMRPDQIPIETGVNLNSIYGKDNYDIFHYLKNPNQTGKK